jgi:hypothetical protein
LSFVQRICGAEPVSLSRFASVRLENMVAGLNAGFAGRADPENLIVQGLIKWDVLNRNYGFPYRTFLFRESTPAEDVLRQQSRRLAYLRREFLQDVATSDKIFVVWRREPFDRAEVVPLFDALRRRGPASLLYVVPDEPVGIGGDDPPWADTLGHDYELF